MPPFSSTLMQPHFASHLRAAAIGDHLVIMDLAANSYVCVAGALIPASDDTPLIERINEATRLALIEDGVLVAKAEDGLEAADLPAYPTRDLPFEMPPAWPGLATTVELLARIVLAQGARRFPSPARWLRRLNSKDRFDVLPEAEIVWRVRQVQSAALYLPGMSGCLVNSMVLHGLLRSRGARTRWVFGVRLHPFEAHCWVQWRDLVLNDRVEHVRWFTPVVAA
ncbi:lasso peptide biosynthesis B2 protein [Flavisphingomonas formosensis]|uniref:lasso peptide biosynthesis B2 protein n=1 Tax=Flavisphingomonas formosensis TaxID=861534 RepID=UPI0018DF630C|nr:lasso peptide biosynthesis B2 protein [Sphingomonas formosensis]